MCMYLETSGEAEILNKGLGMVSLFISNLRCYGILYTCQLTCIMLRTKSHACRSKTWITCKHDNFSWDSQFWTTCALTINMKISTQNCPVNDTKCRIWILKKTRLHWDFELSTVTFGNLPKSSEHLREFPNNWAHVAFFVVYWRVETIVLPVQISSRKTCLQKEETYRAP